MCRDPVGEEYFAAASETISQEQIDGKFNGDCDDHAILMAACLKFVGAEVRLVRTTHHIYPELRVGSKDQLDKAIFLIRHKLLCKGVQRKKCLLPCRPRRRHLAKLRLYRQSPRR